MSYTAYIEHLCNSKGINAAYEEACKTIRSMGADADALWSSRFFVRQIQDDGSKKLCPTTERRVSQAYDEQDREPVPEFLYCDEDGQLYPVTVGAQGRHGPDPDGPDVTPFIYASSDMIANGKVVGHVSHTDH